MPVLGHFFYIKQLAYSMYRNELLETAAAADHIYVITQLFLPGYQWLG